MDCQIWAVFSSRISRRSRYFWVLLPVPIAFAPRRRAKMVASIGGDSLRFLITTLGNVAYTRYVAGAAITLVMHDSFILLKTESSTIWTSKWTFAKFLYYFMRVTTIPFLAIAAYDLADFVPAYSDDFCQIWLSLISVPEMLTFAAGNWLFTLRLIALYKQQRAFIWFMRIFFVITYAVSGTFLVLTIVTYHRLGLYYNPVSKCCYSSTPIPYTSPIFYSTAFYELVLFSLTIYRAYRDSDLTSTINSRLLMVLYRDGAAAFIIMLLMKSWNIWVLISQPISLTHLATNMYWAVYVVLITRTYLNIVWIVRKPAGASSLPTGTDESTPAPSATIGGTPIVPNAVRRVTLRTHRVQRSSVTFDEEKEEDETLGRNGNSYPLASPRTSCSGKPAGVPTSATRNAYSSYGNFSSPVLPPIDSGPSLWSDAYAGWSTHNA